MKNEGQYLIERLLFLKTALHLITINKTVYNRTKHDNILFLSMIFTQLYRDVYSIQTHFLC
jgi:hypothetical protein